MRTGPPAILGPPRRGAFSRVLPLSLLLSVLVLGAVGHRHQARRARPVHSARWIDPAVLLGEGLAGLADPRWEGELALALASVPPFQVGDDTALAGLRAALESLSFVAEVAYLAATRDGIEIEIGLREPVAVVPVERSFQMVAADGVLLSGFWPGPTRWDGAPLPVLGPMRDANGLFRQARAGDWLVEPEHLDALDVAISMREHLSREERTRLGRIVIDATRARVASVEEPGVRLLLEGRRLILFGRVPSTDEPGELAASEKWRSVASALAAREAAPVAMDWDLVDVRWDQPDIALRTPPRLAVASEERAARRGPGTDPGGTRARPLGPEPALRPASRREADRPRVR